MANSFYTYTWGSSTTTTYQNVSSYTGGNYYTRSPKLVVRHCRTCNLKVAPHDEVQHADYHANETLGLPLDS